MMGTRSSHHSVGHWLSLVALVGLILFGAFGSDRVRAQEALPTEPLLRINTEQHTAMIRRVATDAQNRYVVTASEDKTARVWSLPDGRLLGAPLRVPIGEGNTGKLYAM